MNINVSQEKSASHTQCIQMLALRNYPSFFLCSFMMPSLDFAVLSSKSAVKISLYLDDSLKHCQPYIYVKCGSKETKLLAKWNFTRVLKTPFTFHLCFMSFLCRCSLPLAYCSTALICAERLIISASISQCLRFVQNSCWILNKKTGIYFQPVETYSSSWVKLL